jgi:hypothetical protein
MTKLIVALGLAAASVSVASPSFARHVTVTHHHVIVRHHVVVVHHTPPHRHH